MLIVQAVFMYMLYRQITIKYVPTGETSRLPQYEINEQVKFRDAGKTNSQNDM